MLSALDNNPDVWSMDIFADADLDWREQDTAVLYIYVRLVGEHYQPNMRDPVTIITTVRHVSNAMLFEAITMAVTGDTGRLQTFIILTSFTSEINNDPYQAEYPIASWTLLHDKGDIQLFIMNHVPTSTFSRMMETFFRRLVVDAESVYHQLNEDFPTDDLKRRS